MPFYTTTLLRVSKKKKKKKGAWIDKTQYGLFFFFFFKLRFVGFSRSKKVLKIIRQKKKYFPLPNFIFFNSFPSPKIFFFSFPFPNTTFLHYNLSSSWASLSTDHLPLTVKPTFATLPENSPSDQRLFSSPVIFTSSRRLPQHTSLEKQP